MFKPKMIVNLTEGKLSIRAVDDKVLSLVGLNDSYEFKDKFEFAKYKKELDRMVSLGKLKLGDKVEEVQKKKTKRKPKEKAILKAD